MNIRSTNRLQNRHQYGMILIFVFATLFAPVCSLAQTTKFDSLQVLADQAQGLDKIPYLESKFNLAFPRDIGVAGDVCDQYESILKLEPSEEYQLDFYSMKGLLYNYTGRMDSLLIMCNYGLAIAKKLNDVDAQRDFYANLGMYQERAGSLDSAISYYHIALDFDLNGKFKLYNNLGRAYARNGDLIKGIDYLELAMLDARALKLDNVEAVVANNIGSCYLDYGNKDKAIKYFKRSVALKEKISDRRGMLFGLLNLASSFDIPDENRVYALQGKKIAEEIKHAGFVLMFKEVLARISMNEGKYQEALDELLPIYEESKSYQGPERQPILHTLSELYYKLEEYEKSKSIALEKYEIDLASHSITDIQSSRGLLLDVYQKQKDYKAYFDIATAYYPIRDSTNQEERIEKFSELESQLDEEQKEKVALLNSTIAEKEKSQWRLGIIGLLIASILLLLLYFRNKRIKYQTALIKKEKEAADGLLILNTKLKEVDQFKSRLYTNISHEFRTPLTVILGMSQQLEENSEVKAANKSDSSISRKIKLIKRNGNSLLDLVNKMLDLSKLEDNTLSIEYEQGDIVKYLSYLGESFHSMLEARKLDFSLITSDPSIIMDYDAEKMRQIITNLMSNAIKHTPVYGHIELHIDQADDTLNIVVRDTGTGISAASLPHVFDRFYQAEDAVSKAGGTGIGLALTKELVELLGGSIVATSELGRGSEFNVSLPIKRESTTQISEAVFPAPVILKDAEPEQIESPSGKPTVLIIEDNIDVAEYIASCLEGEYEIDVRYDGKAGAERALDTIPDLIISDVMMPEKNGYEVCEMLKLDPRTSHVPLILLTAKASHEERLEGLETGADEYLIKPFDPQELEIRVRKLIELRQTLREQYAQSDLLQPPAASMSSVDKEFLENVRMSVETHLDDGQFGVEVLASEVSMSKVHLNRKLNALMDMSANKFIQAFRLQRAHEMLLQKTGNVSEIAMDTGFNSTSYFTKCFREKYDKTPSEVLEAT